MDNPDLKNTTKILIDCSTMSDAGAKALATVNTEHQRLRTALAEEVKKREVAEEKHAAEVKKREFAEKKVAQMEDVLAAYKTGNFGYGAFSVEILVGSMEGALKTEQVVAELPVRGRE